MPREEATCQQPWRRAAGEEPEHEHHHKLVRRRATKDASCKRKNVVALAWPRAAATAASWPTSCAGERDHRCRRRSVSREDVGPLLKKETFLLARLRAKQAERMGGAYLSGRIGGEYETASGGGGGGGGGSNGLARY